MGTWEGDLGPPRPVLSGTATASKSGDQLDVFAILDDAGLWINSLDFPGPWQGWGQLGGNWVGSPAAISKQNGQLDIFVKDTSGALYTQWFNPRENWSGWRPLGGQVSTSPAAVGRGTSFTIFAADAKGDLTFAVDSIEYGLGQWFHFSDHFPLRDAVAAVQLIYTDDCVVLGRGRDDRMWEKWRVNGVWQEWNSIPGGYLASAPCAVMPNGNLMYAFIQGTDSSMYMNICDTPTRSWSGWVRVPTSVPIQGSPSAASKKPGHIDLFFKGPGGQLIGKGGVQF